MSRLPRQKKILRPIPQLPPRIRPHCQLRMSIIPSAPLRLQSHHSSFATTTGLPPQLSFKPLRSSATSAYNRPLHGLRFHTGTMYQASEGSQSHITSANPKGSHNRTGRL
ncbi:hypothetical protein FRC02_003076 [Tulasnella sp. 418]|nr:hypothetical protein FRC02_003076 [Tulasnella sp. 418]